jgi:hypothetical protein
VHGAARSKRVWGALSADSARAVHCYSVTVDDSSAGERQACLCKGTHGDKVHLSGKVGRAVVHQCGVAMKEADHTGASRSSDEGG